MTSPAELLQTELRAKLDGQLATLESARTRAGVAVSASGVVAGLFAQHLTGPLNNWDLAALAAFIIGSIPAIWILLPHAMTLSPKAQEWIDFASKHEAFVRGQLKQSTPNPEAVGDLGTAQLAVAMTESMADWYKKNVAMLNLIHWCVAAAFAAVMIQIVCWAGSIDKGLGNMWIYLAVIGGIVLITLITLIIQERCRRPKAGAEAASEQATAGAG